MLHLFPESPRDLEAGEHGVAKSLMIPSMLVLLRKSNSVFIGLRVLSVLFADSILIFILLDSFTVFVCMHVLRKSQNQ